MTRMKNNFERKKSEWPDYTSLVDMEEGVNDKNDDKNKNYE